MYSGLWDGVHGTPYASTAKVPPIGQGIVRTLANKRGMFGVVRGLGQIAPTAVDGVQAKRSDQAVIGTFDYAKWKADPDDATRFVRDVTVANLGDDTNTTESVPCPPDASGAEVTDIYNTMLNNEYKKDDADTGATAVALPETRAT